MSNQASISDDPKSSALESAEIESPTLKPKTEKLPVPEGVEGLHSTIEREGWKTHEAIGGQIIQVKEKWEGARKEGLEMTEETLQKTVSKLETMRQAVPELIGAAQAEIQAIATPEEKFSRIKVFSSYQEALGEPFLAALKQAEKRTLKTESSLIQELVKAHPEGAVKRFEFKDKQEKFVNVFTVEYTTEEGGKVLEVYDALGSSFAEVEGYEVRNLLLSSADGEKIVDLKTLLPSDCELRCLPGVGLEGLAFIAGEKKIKYGDLFSLEALVYFLHEGGHAWREILEPERADARSEARAVLEYAQPGSKEPGLSEAKEVVVSEERGAWSLALRAMRALQQGGIIPKTGLEELRKAPDYALGTYERFFQDIPGPAFLKGRVAKESAMR